MSVAFRRDGDDEHREPRFEIPIPPGPNFVTMRGKALIDEKVHSFARNLDAAQDETAREAAKRDLRYWQARQITAEVVPPPAGNVVAFGTTVSFVLQGTARTLSIVGTDEAEGAAGLLPFTAPLARAMTGAEPGDLLSFGGKEDAIEVLTITVLPAGPDPAAP